MKKMEIGPVEMRHLAGALGKLSFFSEMSMPGLERFIAITHFYEYDAGATIFKKGDIGDGLYVVHTGAIRVIDRPFFFWPSTTIATLGPGEIFGEMALIDQPYRTATVVTEGPTQLFVLLSSDFDRILNENPAFAHDLREIAKNRTLQKEAKKRRWLEKL